MIPDPFVLAVLTVLADTPVPGSGGGLSPDQIRFIVYGVIGALFLGSFQFLNSILALIRFFRTDPPNHSVFATIEDLKEAEQRWQIRSEAVDKRFDLMETRIEKKLAEIEKEFRVLNRSLGRVEKNGD